LAAYGRVGVAEASAPEPGIEVQPPREAVHVVVAAQRLADRVRVFLVQLLRIVELVAVDQVAEAVDRAPHPLDRRLTRVLGLGAARGEAGDHRAERPDSEARLHAPEPIARGDRRFQLTNANRSGSLSSDRGGKSPPPQARCFVRTREGGAREEGFSQGDRGRARRRGRCARSGRRRSDGGHGSEARRYPGVRSHAGHEDLGPLGAVRQAVPDQGVQGRRGWSREKKPYLIKAFKAAGVSARVVNAQGDPQKQKTQADQCIADWAKVL